MTWMRTTLLAVGTLAVTLLSTAALSDDDLNRAISLAAEERYEEARQLLDPLLEREQLSPQARLLDGILHVYEGSRGEATAVFGALTRNHPDLFEAHNNLAVLYAEEGRLDEALATLLAILERRQESVGYQNLGDIYVQLARLAYARGRELGSGGGTAPPDGDLNLDGTHPFPDVSDASAEPAMADTPSEEAGGESIDEAEMVSKVASHAGIACMVAGEFRDPHAAIDAQRWLQSHGGEIVDVRLERREISNDYRVYLPPLASREHAREAMRALRREGIRDVSVILHEPLRNGISFGVYNDMRNVERRVARLKRLGYAVQLAGNSTRHEEYTVIEARVNGTRDALRAAWASRFPEHSIQQVDCI